MFRNIIAAMFAVSVAQMPVSAAAGPLVEKATEAERLLDGGDATAALDLLNEATEIVWDAAPLTVRKALYIEDSSGYGLYIERPVPAIFGPGEKILVYVEPVGYGYGRGEAGSLSISFDVDFTLADPDGNALFSKDNFLEIGSQVRYRNREFFLKMTVNLTGLGPGDYVAKFRLRDQNSDKSAEFQLPFSVSG